MKLTYAIDIDNTPENVFPWIGIPEKALEWQTNIGATELIYEAPGMIGTTFRETIEEDGRSTEMHGIVTDYRENHILAMHLEGKYIKVDVAYRLEDMAGYTRLTMVSNIRYRSFLKILSIILWPAFRKKLLGQFDTEYARLKELCERDT